MSFIEWLDKPLNVNLASLDSRVETGAAWATPPAGRQWLALHGYARTGKDSFYDALKVDRPAALRAAFGDIIKERCDAVLLEYTGISAFTQVDAEKEQIRGFLVEYGYKHYSAVFGAYFQSIRQQPFVVNTRIFRLEECLRWRNEGGIVMMLERPGFAAREPKEALELARCLEAGVINGVIHNTSHNLTNAVSQLLDTTKW